MPQTDVPPGTIRRLTEHYGSAVKPWLDGVETTLASAAKHWKINLSGYHDAGWTSVVAGRTQPASKFKALPDRSRYKQERAALLHWHNAPVNRPPALRRRQPAPGARRRRWPAWRH